MGIARFVNTGKKKAEFLRYLGFILLQPMPCGVPTPLRGRPEARRPGVCLPFEEWAGKKRKVSVNIWYTGLAGDTTLDLSH